ncbi:MAG TPA: iron-containing alcohol dehydrogenase [Bryobacteraceae bacterium]|jgi:alcohol dehydrogenase
MTPFDFRPRTRVLFGPGEFARLGEVAREANGTRCLLVADPVLEQASKEAQRALKARRIEVFSFSGFGPNPDSAMIEAGRAFAAPLGIDVIVSLGGGSSMDCAKGINFVLTNGGRMRDYWGYAKAPRPLLPMIAVPTTAGTGSEAQSFCIILDTETGARMACGDPKATFRTAILDPKLTLSQPKELAASTGYDALSHALETLVTTRHTALSECFSRSAWRLINSGFERMIAAPQDLDARGELLLGAHFGGLAVENSMLGAAHACGMPLTSNFGIPHGIAMALLLRHVVRWNRPVAGHLYDELVAPGLEDRLEQLAETAGLPLSLREAGVPEEALPRLAEDAATQWTGRFNPRPLDAGGALEIYQWAL